MVRSSWFTPLCPAGHLPLKGGDRLVETSRPSATLRIEYRGYVLPISPLEGEMSGRTEGGIPPTVPNVGERPLP
ncbi:hypothetical protein DSM25558_1732 [Agrobacterium sp. DSM 25558]|nr:hypothetical protein DSM25558_1732 [Agrobacterium sp. DSM 25558]